MVRPLKKCQPPHQGVYWLCSGNKAAGRTLLYHEILLMGKILIVFSSVKMGITEQDKYSWRASNWGSRERDLRDGHLNTAVNIFSLERSITLLVGSHVQESKTSEHCTCSSQHWATHQHSWPVRSVTTQKTHQSHGAKYSCHRGTANWRAQSNFPSRRNRWTFAHLGTFSVTAIKGQTPPPGQLRTILVVWDRKQKEETSPHLKHPPRRQI